MYCPWQTQLNTSFSPSNKPKPFGNTNFFGIKYQYPSELFQIGMPHFSLEGVFFIVPYFCGLKTPTTMTPTIAECFLKTTSGQCCSIPFSYGGVTYHSCTTADYHRLWCSLDASYTGNWGDCG